jgi:hypothetical protein
VVSSRIRVSLHYQHPRDSGSSFVSRAQVIARPVSRAAMPATSSAAAAALLAAAVEDDSAFTATIRSEGDAFLRIEFEIDTIQGGSDKELD